MFAVPLPVILGIHGLGWFRGQTQLSQRLLQLILVVDEGDDLHRAATPVADERKRRRVTGCALCGVQESMPQTAAGSHPKQLLEIEVFEVPQLKS